MNLKRNVWNSVTTSHETYFIPIININLETKGLFILRIIWNKYTNSVGKIESSLMSKPVVYIQKLTLCFRMIYDFNSSQASVNTNICFQVI